jgi:hypothetical protein
MKPSQTPLLLFIGLLTTWSFADEAPKAPEAPKREAKTFQEQSAEVNRLMQKLVFPEKFSESAQLELIQQLIQLDKAGNKLALVGLTKWYCMKDDRLSPAFGSSRANVRRYLRERLDKNIATVDQLEKAWLEWRTIELKFPE